MFSILGDTISRVFRDLVTGVDGTSHDIARWSWFITVMMVLAGECWNAWHGSHFDIKEVAESVAILAAAHGAAIFAKKDTEPKERPDPK